MLSNESSVALDNSLKDLYQPGQDGVDLTLADRYSPLIRVDDNEPFRPLAAGITIFKEDGRSASFNRRIQLRRGLHRSSFVIEYAIWWDWDINHLYELEHIWVYVDQAGNINWVEGSWHGDIKELGKGKNLQKEGDHPIVLASPGKHAFAPQISDFKIRQSNFPGVTSRFAGTSGITINKLFAGRIQRTPIGDRLIHSYLTRFSFTPSWTYSRRIALEKRMLVPWPTLQEWIPVRIQSWLSSLAKEIKPSQYRTLRLSSCFTLDQVYLAGELGMDMVKIDVGRNRLGMPVQCDDQGQPTGANLLRVLRACSRAHVGAYLTFLDERIIPWVTRLLNRRNWTDYLMTGAQNPLWVAAIKARLPQYRTVLIVDQAQKGIISTAKAVKASYIQIREPKQVPIPTSWILRLQQADIGIVYGPTRNAAHLAVLEDISLEGIIV